MPGAVLGKQVVFGGGSVGVGDGVVEVAALGEDLAARSGGGDPGGADLGDLVGGGSVAADAAVDEPAGVRVDDEQPQGGLFVGDHLGDRGLRDDPAAGHLPGELRM